MQSTGPTGGSRLLLGLVAELHGHSLHAEVCREVLRCRDEGLDEEPPHLDINVNDDRAGTVLHWACAQRLGEVALAVIECRHFSHVGAARQGDGSTALHIAASEGLPDVVQSLLACERFAGAAAAQDRDGFTALHGAAFRGHVAIVAELLASSEGRSAAGVEGSFDVARPPDHWAAEAAGLCDCRTALHLAAVAGHSGVCEALLALSGAACNANATNRLHATALHMAARGLHTDACRALLSCREFTNLDARDTRGLTALHWAALQPRGDICAALLARQDFKAVESKDLRGRTAAEIALLEGHHEVRRLILQRLGPAALESWAAALP